MPILPEYTSRIHARERRRADYKFMHPFSDETDDEIQQQLVNEERAYLDAEIAPYTTDLQARLGGKALTHPELLDGSTHLRYGKPVHYMLFQDTDGVHRIIAHSPKEEVQEHPATLPKNVVPLQSLQDRTQREVYALGREKIITSEATNELIESWQHLFASNDPQKTALAFEVLSNAVENGDAPHWLLEILYQAYLSDTPPSL